MVRGSFDGERMALELAPPVPEPAGAAARRPALEPARALHRGGRRAARARRPPARRRGRHVGRRLRAARSAGRLARAAVPLPRLSRTRGHDRPRGRACPSAERYEGDRHPDDADQHRLPAARRLQGGGRGGGSPSSRICSRTGCAASSPTRSPTPPPPACSTRGPAPGRASRSSGSAACAPFAGDPVEAGTTLGPVHSDHGIDAPVHAVASHDTASAFVAAPVGNENAAICPRARGRCSGSSSTRPC